MEITTRQEEFEKDMSVPWVEDNDGKLLDPSVYKDLNVNILRKM